MEEKNEQDQKPEKAPPPQMLHVHNVTRGRQNRTLRAQQPKHHALKQYLGGGKYRSIRGRPIKLTEEEFVKHLPEIKQKVAAGIFELRTPDGRLLAFDDERLVLLQDLPAPPPKPKPPLDSIANDKQNVGQEMPQFPGGDTLKSSEVPDLVKTAEEDETSPETQSEEDLTELNFDDGEGDGA